MRPFCLIICTWLFLFAGCAPDPVETDLLVPVKFAAVPAGLTRTQFYTRHIEVRVKGRPGKIRQVEALDLTYLVDLYADLTSDPVDVTAFIPPAFYAIPVIKKRLPLPPGVDIIHVKPAYIKVELDRKETRRLPVKVMITGEPAVGYEVAHIKSEPATMALTGPASLFDKITEIQTKPVDITGADADLKKTGSLDIDALAGADVNSLVTVMVAIQEKIVTHTYGGIPVGIRNGPDTVQVTPPEMQIMLRGAANVFKDKDNAGYFEVFIDLKDLPPGVYVRPAVINVPVGVMLVSAKPENFTVTIK
ncbi:CdaR family protein [Desulfocicer vacuolatum]|uniref:CdaR family protein n=1 Tax=Desulfocicer vacuolatum TaxID=2298 RepID=UPI001481D9C1|nr:CdaR family protein [Desulfocicer vacuolatum]